MRRDGAESGLVALRSYGQPLSHTAGAALGQGRARSRTRFGMATLMVAANLPDIDVAVFFTDTLPMSFRRGWTHGVLAQVDVAHRARRRRCGVSDRDAPQAATPTAHPLQSPSISAPAVVRRRVLARLPGLPEQLRPPAADAVLGSLVLRRRALHRGSVALSACSGPACGWRRALRSRCAAAAPGRRRWRWCWRRSTWSVMLASNLWARSVVRDGLTRAGAAGDALHGDAGRSSTRSGERYWSTPGDAI